MKLKDLIIKENRQFNNFTDSYFKKYKTKSFLLQAMIYGTINGGKRLRPFLVISLAKYLKLKKANYMRVALAVELIHCYSLIHDDLPSMDNDTWRRGVLTTHKKFDEATAILSGNSLLTLAFEILADKKTHSNPNIRNKLITTLADISGSKGLAGGQSLDLIYEKKKVTENEILKMHYLKTARLFEFCICAPLIMDKANTKQIKEATLYGKNFGLIFQAIDDLLDTTGNKKTLGKNVKKDILRNKGNILRFKNHGEVKKYCTLLAEKATEKSKIFGKNNRVLKELIFSIIDRTS